MCIRTIASFHALTSALSFLHSQRYCYCTAFLYYMAMAANHDNMTDLGIDEIMAAIETTHMAQSTSTSAAPDTRVESYIDLLASEETEQEDDSLEQMIRLLRTRSRLQSFQKWWLSKESLPATLQWNPRDLGPPSLNLPATVLKQKFRIWLDQTVSQHTASEIDSLKQQERSLFERRPKGFSKAELETVAQRVRSQQDSKQSGRPNPRMSNSRTRGRGRGVRT
jgi:hypothetical protein